MSITAERKTKRQKNGNIHNYVYYRCIKKLKAASCREPFIREEELDRQLSKELQKFSLPEDWARQLNQMADKDEQTLAQSSAILTQETQKNLKP